MNTAVSWLKVKIHVGSTVLLDINAARPRCGQGTEVIAEIERSGASGGSLARLETRYRDAN